MLSIGSACERLSAADGGSVWRQLVKGEASKREG